LPTLRESLAACEGRGGTGDWDGVCAFDDVSRRLGGTACLDATGRSGSARYLSRSARSSANTVHLRIWLECESRQH
jgi:hypothetical protein